MKGFLIAGDGTHSQSNTYVDDVVDSNELCVFNSSAHLYSRCGDEEITIDFFDKTVGRILNFNLKINYTNECLGDQDRTRRDSTKFKGELGWNAKTNFNKGVKNQILFEAESQFNLQLDYGK